MLAQAPTTEPTSPDIPRRKASTTDGVGYETGYAYNLSGALVEQRYPSGRVVKNVLDASGDLSMVQSARCMDAAAGTGAGCTAQAGLWNYARHFTYNAAGAVTSMQLGNGRWESTVFNSRLQPVQIALGSTGTGAQAHDLLKLDYGYGGANNNGNVLSQTITVPSVTIGGTTHNGFTAVQNYTYDSLNRLKQATEMITSNGGSQSLSWQQTFVYDRYGNRNFDEANTTTLPKDCTESGNPVVCEAIRPIVNPSVNTANNRLNGYTFDAAGNTTVDAEGRTFTYDAENKQVIVKDSQNQTIGEYSYDGDAKRVKKFLPATGETSNFVYDVEAKMVAEYSIEIEQTPRVSYLTHDHLGSPRLLTDQFGAIISRRDFMPFGEEIARSGYGQDSVREKFATYERDSETDLDFAQARMHGYKIGRFTSPDPYNIVLEIELERDQEVAREKLDRYLLRSQQWNRYVYVTNNPLLFVDPSGEILRLTGSDADNEKVFNLLKEMLGEKAAKNLSYAKTDDGWVVEYKSGSGGLAINGTAFGVALEDLIDSSKVTSMKLTPVSDIGMDAHGGAKTTLSQDNNNISIKIHVDSPGTNERLQRNTLGTDGKPLSFTLSIVVAHELGHAWGLVRDKTGERYDQLRFYQRADHLRLENNDRAVQLENIERQRLGLGLRWRH